MTTDGVIPGAGPVAYSAYAAMVCAGAAAWLMAGAGDPPGRARLLLADGAEPVGRGLPQLPDRLRNWSLALRRRFDGRAGHEWWCLPGALLLTVLGASWIPLLLGIAAVPLVRRLLLCRRAVREARAREAAVVELCAAMAGELRAGRQPEAALLAAPAETTERFGEAGAALLAAARFAGDVPAALRNAARRPGGEGLSGVAACWQVAVEGGAGLASGLDRVGAAVRTVRDQREDLRAQLSGPRSTAVALALLPVVGLLLGGAMDARPLDVLLHSPAGLACLAAGALLEAAGLAWVARIVRGAEGAAEPAGGRR